MGSISRTDTDIAGVKLTHPERILWAEPGITNQGLADFYADIADWILPHVSGRVLSLSRCPSGTGGKCFFAKHPWHRYQALAVPSPDQSWESISRAPSPQISYPDFRNSRRF
jgi:DNA primase